jgi:hypothetical protein
VPAVTLLYALLSAIGTASATCPSTETVLADLTCSSTVSGRIDNSASSDIGGSCGGSEGCYSCGDPYTRLPQREGEDVYSFTC